MSEAKVIVTINVTPRDGDFPVRIGSEIVDRVFEFVSLLPGQDRASREQVVAKVNGHREKLINMVNEAFDHALTNLEL
jgi:hypothetical protein